MSCLFYWKGAGDGRKEADIIVGGDNRAFFSFKEKGMIDNPKKDDPKDFQEYCEFQKKYDSLKADERVLDRLFEKTRHAKEIDEVATALVEAFISNLEGKGDLDKAAATIAEGIKDYSTDKRGR